MLNILKYIGQIAALSEYIILILSWWFSWLFWMSNMVICKTFNRYWNMLILCYDLRPTLHLELYHISQLICLLPQSHLYMSHVDETHPLYFYRWRYLDCAFYVASLGYSSAFSCFLPVSFEYLRSPDKWMKLDKQGNIINLYKRELSTQAPKRSPETHTKCLISS